MRLCTVFLLTFVISLTCVFTAPLEKRNPSPADGTGVAATSTSTAKNAAGKFAKFADQYVKPIWLSNKGPKGSKKSKKKKKSKKNDGDPAKGKSNRKGNNRRRRRNSNKNNRKRLNGFKLAFIVPLSELIGDFQEDRNVEDKMKIIMTWNDSDDKQIVLIEPFDTLSSNKPHKNQLTRQKRDYTSQITSSEFKPLKETLITPNEDITELGYYRNNKLNSIFKKLENNKIAGHNEFEESLWNESQIEENGLNSLENADEEIRALGLNIAKATSNPYDNVKDQDDHSSKIINTKLGVLSDESTNYIPNFEDVENETITYENSQPNLKQNELSTKNSNTNIKPLTKLSQHNNNNPKMEENTHQPPVINSKPSKNQINNNLKNNSDNFMLEEDTNSGKSFSNFPKQTEIEKQTEKIQPISNIKFDDFIRDFSVETEEMSQKNPIFNDFKRNRLKETISKPKENLNDTKRNVPKTKESAQDYTNDVFKNNKPKNTMNIVEHPDIKIPNNAKNKMSKEDRIFPKFSSMHNQGLNKLDKLMDANIEDTFNDSSPDIKKSAKYNPTFNRLKDNGLQNTSKNLDESARQVPNDLKTEMSKQNNDIPRVFSTNIPEFNKIEKLENMSNLKHFKNPDDDAKDFSLETEELSIEIPFHENIKRDKSQHMMNKTRFPNISESSGSVDTNENKELPEIKHLQKLNNSKGNNKISVKLSPKIVSTSNTSKMNRVPQKSSNVPKLNENPIFRDDSLHISDFNKLEGLPQVNIPKTLSTNVDKLSDNAIQTKLEVKTSDSKLTKQNLLDTNETFKFSTPKIDNKSQVVRSDSLENKSFLNSFENFSDELEGAIIVTTGSISSSKDHTKQKSSKIDGNRSKYDEKDFSNNPITGDVVGHRKIKNDENLERSNTIDAKPMKTINDDSNEDISNNISFNSDEDTNTNDIKKLSEANDMPINEPIFGNSKVSKKTMNNNTHNDNNKIQQSKNEIKNFEPKSNSVEDSSLPLKSIKPIKEHMLKPTNNKRNSDITNMISKPKTDEPTMAVNSSPSNILSKNISLKLPNNELKATDGEIQTPINEDTSKQNYDTNQYTSNPNNDPFDSLGGESFFDSIEHLPPSGLKIAPNSGNTVLTNDDNEKPIDNEYKTKNNIPNIKFKEISSELTNDNLNIDNDQLINPAEGINNVIDDTFSPNQFNSNDFDPFNDLEDKSFLMSNEMVSNELQNVPVSENSNLNKQQIKKTDIDDKVQSFSDTTPNKDNLGGKNEDIENPTDKTHKNNNLNNLSQNSIHNPLDSNIDTSFFNSFTELSNELSSKPINENFNSSKKENEKLDTDEKNRSMLEMAANESLSSKNKNKIDDILTPKHDKPIIAANFNPSTIGSNNIPLESSNHESKAIDNEIQTPVNEDTGKQNYNINQYTPKPNNDPFDSLGGKSFFDSIEHLPPSGLEIASKSGNTILTNGNNEKPINNGYKTENNIPKTQFKEISSELSNNYLNMDNDPSGLINPGEVINNGIDDAFSPKQLNSNDFDPFNGLEDKSFLMSNEMVSNELQNAPVSENSSLKKQQIKKTDIDDKFQSFSDTTPDEHNLEKKIGGIENPTDHEKHKNNNLNNLSQNSIHNPLDSNIDTSFFNPFTELSNELSSAPINEDFNSSKKENEKLDTDEKNRSMLEMAANESLSSKNNDKIDNMLTPKHDEPVIAANFNPSTIGSNNIPLESSNHESKAIDNEIQTPVNENTGKQNYNINPYTPKPNNDLFDNLGGESFFDSIEHLPPSGLEIAPNSGNTVLTNDDNEKPIDNEYKTKNNIPSIKFKEISSELTNDNLNIDNDQLINPAEGINNVIDDTFSPKQLNSNDFDPFNGLEDKSFLMSNEMVSNELQNVPVSENSSLKKQQIKKTDIDDKFQSFSDTTPDEHNLGKKIGGIENPTDHEKHKNNNLNNLSQNSIHNPLDSNIDTSFFNPFTELSNELLSAPINEDFNSSKKENEKLDTDDKNLSMLEMAANESLSSKNNNKIDDMLSPKHDKPIIAANFNPSTIGSNNIPLESSNHESKATDNEIQTPVNEDTGKKNYNINPYTPKPNNDPFDSLGGKSFFDSIERLPPSGLEIASKSGDTILTNGNNEKPINNGYKTENNIPKTQFEEISSELSNSYLNIDNDQLINPAEGISDVINEPLSPNQFNSNSFGPINSLEESFSTLNERVSDESHNLPIIENSDVNYNRSENNKSDESKVLPDISKKVSLTSEIKKKTSDTLNNNKTTAENYSGNPKAPHIFNSITYNPYLSNNKEYSSVDENNSQSNTKVSKITSPDIKYSKEGSLSTKSNQQKTGPFISQLNPTDSVYSDGSYQDIFLDDNSLPKTLDLIDEKSGADKGDLSEIFDTQHKLPSDRETINAHHVLKAEPIDHINNTDKSTKESIDELKSTLLKQKSKEISSELLNSALNTFDGKIQSPSDNNNQCKTDKPKSFEEHISNQVYDPFSSLEGESFFNPVKHLPTNKPQNLSKAENAVSMNEHNPKIIKDTTKDTPNKPKFKNNSSGLLHNGSDFITGKTNNSFDSVKDSINKSQITDQFTSKQSHDLSNSLEDKSLTFPNGIFSEEQQNVPIIDDLFLEKCQNKLPTTSEKTNVLPETYTTEPLSSKTDVKESDTLNLSDLPESKLTRTSKAQNSLNPTIVNSNVLNSHLKPINTPVDGDEKKKSEDAKNNLEKKFEEHFIDSKSDIDKGNLSGFISDTDDTKKLNKYLEKINKIINNANLSNTNLKLAQPQPNTSSNAEKKQKSIIFSPTASNHQYTNIFKNPETNKFPSISDSGVLTNSHNQIDNTEITTLSSPHHEKPESVDLNEQKSGYNLNDLASTSIKTVYDYLSSDNKDGKLDDNTLSKTMSVNNGNNNYLADKYDQLSENPLSQQTKEPTYRIENNPKTTISNLSNDIKNLNHFEKDTPKINSETSQVINDSLKGYIPDLIKNSSSNEKNKIYKIFNEVINNRNNIGDFFTPTLDSPVFYPTEISKKQDSNSYGFMIPKFRTKYEGGSSNDLWESIPPKQNKNFKTNNELDNFDSILKAKKIPNENYSSNNMLSSHVNNKDLNAWDGSIKSNNEPNTDRKLDINNNNEFINEYVKSLTEKLLNRMDDIDGKITKLNNFSIDNQGIADEKTDSPKIIEYLSTNTNSNGPSIKNTSIELESKQNEIIEKLDESESENESENESKIRQHKKIKHEKKSGKKRTKHKKNNREKEDSMSEIHRNDKNQKTKNRKKHSDNNNNSYYNSSNASNDVEVGKNHRKNMKTNNSNDSKDVVVKERRKNPYENDSSYSDNISVQPEDSSRRKKKIKRKKIIYSSENDTKENYSSSIGISDKSYDSVRNLKAKDRPKKSKRTKIAEKKSTHKSHSIHSKHSNDLKDTTKNKNRKKYLDDDSSKGKTMVSKKRHVEIHSEDDETKEPKKKKKRIKKKKKKKNIDIKNIKEKDKQAMDYDSDDNKSDEYEYVTFYPKIQYTNPLSRLFM